MAEMIVNRIPEGFTKDHIVDADLLCYYISVLENMQWFPITYIYRSTGTKFELFERLTSSRHFEKVKMLLNVNNPQELKDKLTLIQQEDEKAGSQRIGYSRSFDRVEPIYRIIDLDKIATSR